MSKDEISKPNQEFNTKDEPKSKKGKSISMSVIDEILESPVEDDLEETYKRPGDLDVPAKAKKRFELEGYDLQWKRIYINNGQLDVNNIKKAERAGYTFVTKEEVPEMNTDLQGFFSGEIDKHKDLITMGDLALAKISHARQAKKRAAIDEETRSKSQALIHDLRQNNFKGKYKTTRDQPTRTREIDFGE